MPQNNLTVNCYFCHTICNPQINKRDFLCPSCPHNVYLRLDEGGIPHLTWIRLLYNNNGYQIIWYIKDPLILRIYNSDDNTKKYDMIKEFKSGVDKITPNNISNKIATILTFQ